MNSETNELTYNFAQYVFVMKRTKFNVLEWGRGTGKSTIIGRHIKDCAEALPRANFVLVAETYAQILTRTLPSTISGLEQHGYKNNVHFFVGKRPPKNWNWPEPYEAPLDYKRSIIFYTGFIINFVSQDTSSASGRGMNVDGVISDESVRLNKAKFDTDIILTNRGNLKRVAHYPDGTWKYFKDVPLHHSVLLASTTPLTASGQWFIDFEEKARLDPSEYLFLRASAEVNKENLGEDYFKKSKALLPDFMYKAEVLNERMSKVDNGFYPLLNEELHCYNGYAYPEDHNEFNTHTSLYDDDVLHDQPLEIGVDWGSNFNCMVVSQEYDNTHHFLKNLFVKHQTIDDLMDEFTKYYVHHKKKLIYMYYDPSGNVSVANSNLTFAQQAELRLKTAGWQVVLMTKELHNILHQDKFILWGQLLKANNPSMPDIAFNKNNCNELWISMTSAPAKKGRNEAITKDKKSEKNKNTDQAHATHLSDAADVIVVGKFLNRLGKQTHFIDATVR